MCLLSHCIVTCTTLPKLLKSDCTASIMRCLLDTNPACHIVILHHLHITALIKHRLKFHAETPPDSYSEQIIPRMRPTQKKKILQRLLPLAPVGTPPCMQKWPACKLGSHSCLGYGKCLLQARAMRNALFSSTIADEESTSILDFFFLVWHGLYGVVPAPGLDFCETLSSDETFEILYKQSCSSLRFLLLLLFTSYLFTYTSNETNRPSSLPPHHTIPYHTIYIL